MPLSQEMFYVLIIGRALNVPTVFKYLVFFCRVQPLIGGRHGKCLTITKEFVINVYEDVGLPFCK